jgi:hypothetical protein
LLTAVRRHFINGGCTKRSLQRLLAGPLIVLTALSTSAFAQNRHVVDPAALAAAVDELAAKQDDHRATIRQALDRPEVREVARQLGVDLDRANASIATLDGNDLERVAAAADRVNHSVVGGASSVTLSTTTIIIILLLVILLVVAIK